MRLPRFGPYLQKLCLRQNQIAHLEPDIFHHLTNLDELDFYDNKIKHVGRALVLARQPRRQIRLGAGVERLGHERCRR